jgi:peptidoglycan/LPS O-acetylase OafA/YrhL
MLTQLFSRITQNTKIIYLWDGLRAFAILLVFFQHLLQDLLKSSLVKGEINEFLLIKLIADSTVGVELFFVISGFILVLPFRKQYILNLESLNIRSFYLRRIIRIGGPYLIHLIVIFCFLLIGGVVFETLVPILFSHIFLVTNIVEGRFNTNLMNTVLWSLEIEAQFYLILPLLAIVFRVRNKNLRHAILLLEVILIFIIKHTLTANINNFPITVLDYFPYFIVGIMLSDICYESEKHKQIKYDILVLLNLIVIALIFQINISGRSLILATLLYLLVYFIYNSYYTYIILTSKVIVFIGGISFSIYLWHLPINRILIENSHFSPMDLGYFNMAALIILYSIPVLIFSSLMFLLTERPFMAYRKK